MNPQSSAPADLKPRPLAELLAGSAAAHSFLAAVADFERAPRESELISFERGCPPVKVLRATMKLLEAEPGLAIESIRVEAQSGCSDFRGTIEARLAGGARRRFRFVWDCAWKAQELGWTTYFGDPDQQRAAREYGYQCFERFEAVD